MKLARASLVAVPLVLALGAGTTAAFGVSSDAGAPQPAARPAHDGSRTGVETDAVLPSVGQTWLADFGDDTPFGGPFAAEITFTSATQLNFVVTKGALKGATDSVTYTTTRIRPGLYMVRWHEPKSGANVTHVEDFSQHVVVSSIVAGDQFVQMEGSLTRHK
ncbi:MULTISPECIES: hypothetical protein [Streptomyces]|jgi:hypothetical protein|uniref:MoaF-like domain-containing protein n=1 Tax=Streptomyces sp. 900129855 TaxID=3155129 RepID=A0ABV2ZB11_9ACTN